MKRQLAMCLTTVFVVSLVGFCDADDWSRFRGPDGSGLSPDDTPTPVTWSDSENLKWKVPLPGPGSSSPIVVGGRVYVTCWSGYGTDRGAPGDQKDLKRHLVCVDRETGKTIWSTTTDAVLPEDDFRGMFTQHGYTSHTPVSDGERVYVFYGITGVLAFDLDGNKLWQTSVGTERDRRGWGSASSPILYKNLVIVTASIENQALVALNKDTGEEVWKQEAGGFASTWGTPILVDVGDGRQDLVLAVPYEVWGFNPDDGKLRWYCEAVQSDSMCSSLIVGGDTVYAVERGPRGGGAVAVRAGGKDDVTKTHVVWTANERSRIGTPILYEGRIYWISGGIANCIDAKTGEQVYQSRLAGAAASAEPGRGARSGRGGGRRGFGGGMGGQDYSSPVVADGKMYFVRRSGTAVVVKLGTTFEELAQNRFESDDGDFSATPAISDGELFIRSSKNLYCVSKGE
ncbi:MAG: PQQ-binding-like beta-propeller repeat protein [Planctomycetes bacterium]|nr:PQQ-binding-like beta-propeller repeat protein [Planctomycetota bacterium]MBL7039522.1 PQQ-binding-like beta-propeller repeat protein [Pirellulaceae bacterium]